MTVANNAENKLQDLGDGARDVVNELTGQGKAEEAGDSVKEAGQKVKEAGLKLREARERARNETGANITAAGVKLGEEIKELAEKITSIFTARVTPWLGDGRCAPTE